MSKSEDDKTTRVLDPKELKRLRDQTTITQVGELEFDADLGAEVQAIDTTPLESTSMPLLKTDHSTLPAAIFDLKGDGSCELKQQLFSLNYFDQLEYFSELKDLNHFLKQHSQNRHLIFFNYAASIKQNNQLIAQLKKSFKKTQIIIAAAKLAEDKVQQHKKTEFAAHFYYNLSWSKDEQNNFLISHFSER